MEHRGTKELLQPLEPKTCNAAGKNWLPAICQVACLTEGGKEGEGQISKGQLTLPLDHTPPGLRRVVER